MEQEQQQGKCGACGYLGRTEQEEDEQLVLDTIGACRLKKAYQEQHRDFQIWSAESRSLTVGPLYDYSIHRAMELMHLLLKAAECQFDVELRRVQNLGSVEESPALVVSWFLGPRVLDFGGNKKRRVDTTTTTTNDDNSETNGEEQPIRSPGFMSGRISPHSDVIVDQQQQ